MATKPFSSCKSKNKSPHPNAPDDAVKEATTKLQYKRITCSRLENNLSRLKERLVIARAEEQAACKELALAVKGKEVKHAKRALADAEYHREEKRLKLSDLFTKYEARIQEYCCAKQQVSTQNKEFEEAKTKADDLLKQYDCAKERACVQQKKLEEAKAKADALAKENDCTEGQLIQQHGELVMADAQVDEAQHLASEIQSGDDRTGDPQLQTKKDAD